MSTPVQPSRPLPPFSPASPFSRPPPTSAHRRAPLLQILKTNVLALLALVLVRLSPFYGHYRTFALRSAGLSRDWVNAGETVVVTLLVWNALAAGRKLRASGGLAAGPTLPASAVGRGQQLRGTPMSNKGSPKVRRLLRRELAGLARERTRALTTPSSPLALRPRPPPHLQIRPAPASPSPLSLSSSVSSPSPSLRASTVKPRFSLPASASPPSTPAASGTRTLKQSLNSNSPPHASSPPASGSFAGSASFRGSPLARSDGATAGGGGGGGGKTDVSPVKVWKLRHSLGASGLAGDSSLR